MNSITSTAKVNLDPLKDSVSITNETPPTIRALDNKELFEKARQESENKLNLRADLLESEVMTPMVVSPELSFAELLNLQLDVKRRMDLVEDPKKLIKETIQDMRTNKLEVDKGLVNKDILKHKQALSKIINF